MTTCILYKNDWILIFGAYVRSLTQSELQPTINSPKQRASEHCKIHQDQNYSSAESHPLLLVTGHSAPGTDSRDNKWYIPYTAFAGQSPANPWQKMSTNSQSTGICTRLIWTYLQSICYIAIVIQLRSQLRSNKVSPFMLPRNTPVSNRKRNGQSLRKHTAAAVETAAWPWDVERCMQPGHLSPGHAALGLSLHSGRNCYSVRGKTTLEELSRISKKVEVNKPFFMNTSYPHRWNAKGLASIWRKCTSVLL